MEYATILAPGFHEMTLGEIEQRFVAQFNSSNTRRIIFERFKLFLSLLSDSTIAVEIWVDGSFITIKEDPNDIDIAIFADPNQINSLPDDKKAILSYLFSSQAITKVRFLTDAYFVLNDDIARRSYWRGWFCFTRDETPKGIVRLRSDV